MTPNSLLFRPMGEANLNRKRPRRLKKLYVIIRTENTPEREKEFEAKVELAKRKAGI